MRQAMGANENECYDSVELNAMETDRDGRIAKNFETTLFGNLLHLDLAYPDSSKYLPYARHYNPRFVYFLPTF